MSCPQRKLGFGQVLLGEDRSSRPQSLEREENCSQLLGPGLHLGS